MFGLQSGNRGDARAERVKNCKWITSDATTHSLINTDTQTQTYGGSSTEGWWSQWDHSHVENNHELHYKSIKFFNVFKDHSNEQLYLLLPPLLINDLVFYDMKLTHEAAVDKQKVSLSGKNYLYIYIYISDHWQKRAVKYLHYFVFLFPCACVCVLGQLLTTLWFS